jgi:hypothetical protein
VELRWSIPNNPAGALPPTTSVTDAFGNYSITLPEAEMYVAQNDALHIMAMIRTQAMPVASDILVNSGTCPMRYGVVIDAVTRLPIAGARVEWAGTTETSPDGTYSMSLECLGKSLGTGTMAIRVTHPSYQDYLALISGPSGRP